MLSIKKRSAIARAVFALLAVAVLLPIASCRDAFDESRSGINLAPFKTLAGSAVCVDKRNRLFLIDDRLVFWDRESNDCIDGLYSFTLYGSTVDAVLCERHDAIGGGNVTNCPDPRYRDMFDTIITSLDDPMLGLGPGHSIEAVPF